MNRRWYDFAVGMADSAVGSAAGSSAGGAAGSAADSSAGGAAGGSAGGSAGSALAMLPACAPTSKGRAVALSPPGRTAKLTSMREYLETVWHIDTIVYASDACDHNARGEALQNKLRRSQLCTLPEFVRAYRDKNVLKVDSAQFAFLVQLYNAGPSARLQWQHFPAILSTSDIPHVDASKRVCVMSTWWTAIDPITMPMLSEWLVQVGGDRYVGLSQLYGPCEATLAEWLENLMANLRAIQTIEGALFFACGDRVEAEHINHHAEKLKMMYGESQVKVGVER